MESLLSRLYDKVICQSEESVVFGIRYETASEIGVWHIFPEMIQNVFAANVVAVVFVASIILNLILPKNMEIEKINENE